MNSTIEKYLVDLDEHLQHLQFETDDMLKSSELCVRAVLEALSKLKSDVLRKGFKTKQEEINFFKKQKPLFSSRLIYYNTIYTVEANRPQGGEKVVRKYYNNELQKIKQYFDANIDFYKYYRTGSDYLDEKYFSRGKYDIKLTVDSHFFETDQQFATSHDFKVAQIIANDLLLVYFEKLVSHLELTEIKNLGHNTHEDQKTRLTWTASKAALIELLYGFYHLGTFNNGRSELKEIAIYFEKTFNVELGDFYRTFLELRSRKIAKTKFIDKLRDTLLAKMDELDE